MNFWYKFALIYFHAYHTQQQQQQQQQQQLSLSL